MSGPRDDVVWQGVERRLAGVEAYVRGPRAWRAPEDALLHPNVHVLPDGPLAGSGSRRRVPVLAWVVAVLVLALAVAGALLVAGIAHPFPTQRPQGFSPTAAMPAGTFGREGALLPGGRVLLTGPATDRPMATIYDPATDRFVEIDAPADLAQGTVTPLLDGRVLVIGEQDARAWLFDPRTNDFAQTGSMSTRRVFHVAARLSDGRVLVAGGRTGDPTGTPLASAELYDPSTGRFSPTGSMAGPRLVATATTLVDGRVLVVGGGNDRIGQLATAEVYDPGTGRFLATESVPVALAMHAAVRLADGRVLVVGGYQEPPPDSGTELAAAELYDPATNAFTPTGRLTYSRRAPAATLLPDGRALVTGGDDMAQADLPAELYDPASGTFTAVAGSATAPDGVAVGLADGTVLVAGGVADVEPPVAQIFRP